MPSSSRYLPLLLASCLIGSSAVVAVGYQFSHRKMPMEEALRVLHDSHDRELRRGALRCIDCYFHELKEVMQNDVSMDWQMLRERWVEMLR